MSESLGFKKNDILDIFLAECSLRDINRNVLTSKILRELALGTKI